MSIPRPLVLASSSPSRLSILRSANVEPVVRVSGIDEDSVVAELLTDNPAATPADTVTHLAEAKASAVIVEFGEQLPAGSVVIGADSMLLLDCELQGKPHTAEETVRRWQQQRGKRAELITGHAVIHNGELFAAASTTTVFFGNASDTDIRAYANTGEPWGWTWPTARSPLLSNRWCVRMCHSCFSRWTR